MAIKTASVLAFERKLSNSAAIMLAGNWDDREKLTAWKPIKLQSKDVRGTISNRLKNAEAKNDMNVDAATEKANLQRVEVAALPFDADTLKLCFTLRVLGDLATPSACNEQQYQQALADKINGYIGQHGFHELAARYATNLANGRFLWRNRVGAESVEVRVRHMVNSAVASQWIFNGHDLSLREFCTPQGPLAELADVIRAGLAGDAFALLEVDAYCRLGVGQEVFPSQELVLGDGRDDVKSKYLYEVDGVAAMHSQKIGNALRTIDTWHPAADEVGPIAVEPYGSVTNRGTAYRQPKQKMDFYTLLDSWVLKDNTPPLEQQHYVIAGLIRGGVFGEKAD